MRSRIPASILTAAAVAVLLVILSSGCKGPGSGAAADAALADRLEKLPQLPPDLAATLDPKTNATKTTGGPPEPEKLTAPLPMAPCCSIKDQKQLQVRVKLTKCGPLKDLVLADLSNLLLARAMTGGGGGGSPVTPGGGPAGTTETTGNVRFYKLEAVNRASVWETRICTSSEGPWDATFIEERHCNNYAPVDSLYVTAFGEIRGFFWNGGVQNHPADVSVLSCNEIGTTRFQCGISNCDCTSSNCPPGQQCPCQPPW